VALETTMKSPITRAFFNLAKVFVFARFALPLPPENQALIF